MALIKSTASFTGTGTSDPVISLRDDFNLSLDFTTGTGIGTVKTTTDSQRDVRDYTGGVYTTGDMNKHSVVEVHVNQGGSGVGVSGSSTVYGGMTHGLVEVGASASVGWEAGLSVAWDNSSIHETGTTVTDVDMYDLGGWFPNHVGSSTETTYTNTWVDLANVDYTASSGSWSGSAVYIK